MTDKQPEALRLADRIDLKDYYEFDASLHCQKAAAELRRLHIVEKEFQQWITKTEWVQKSSQSHDLGIHRADVMKQRLDRLSDENEALRAALEQSQAVTNCHQSDYPQGEQETVAWLTIEVMGPRTKVDVEWEDQLQKLPSGIYKLYTSPQPRREPLTDEQIGKIGSEHEKFTKGGSEWFDRWTFARAIEAAHNIK